jgi:hypothetical protein
MSAPNDIRSVISTKENILRVIRRDHPYWVPYGLEGVATIRHPIVERPFAAGPMTLE